MSITVKHAQKEYVFRYSENLDTVCLRVSHETPDFEINQLINLVSFYYRIPLHYFLIAKHKNGQARINCKSLLSISTNPFRVNPKDMLIGDGLENVQEFINKANTKKYFTKARKFKIELQFSVSDIDLNNLYLKTPRG